MTVEWNDRSLRRLSDIYVAEPTPEQREWVANHVVAINARLTEGPWLLGESRGPHHRVWFSHPLVVGYHLPPGGGVVVFHVQRLKDNSQNAS